MNIKDMNGKTLETGHIVAVRYVWNSYVGEVREIGLCATGDKRFAFFGPHPIKPSHTYQILGHIDPRHPDYNLEIHNWYSWTGGECPLKISVYDNMPDYEALSN